MPLFDASLKAAKEGFFDRKKILDAVDKATVQVLSKFGAFVMTRAKSSIRKRKKASAPGSPPSSHVGTLKRLIFFGFDLSTRSEVIGPILSDRPTGAPETLEYGGSADLVEMLWKTRKGKHVREKTEKTVDVKARPFMHPALAKELPGLPAMWANSVR